MQIETINDLIKNKLIVNDVNQNIDDYTIFAVNIFLDKIKNKYKNVTPISCYIKKGSNYSFNDNGFCLKTINKDIYSEQYRYHHIDKIDDILEHGETLDRGSLTYVHKFPELKLFTTKKEAYDYIDSYKRKNNLIKYKEKLLRINNDIEILLNEKKRLENLINNESN